MSKDKNQELRYAASRGNTDRIEKLLYQGADINSIDGNTGLAAIHYAAFNGHASAVKLLVSNGANLNLQTTKDYQFGETGLQKLLRAGSTVLHIAVIKEDDKLIKGFMKDDIKFNPCIRNEDNKLPRDLAATKEIQDIIVHKQILYTSLGLGGSILKSCMPLMLLGFVTHNPKMYCAVSVIGLIGSFGLGEVAANDARSFALYAASSAASYYIASLADNYYIPAKIISLAGFCLAARFAAIPHARNMTEGDIHLG